MLLGRYPIRDEYCISVIWFSSVVILFCLFLSKNLGTWLMLIFDFHWMHLIALSAPVYCCIVTLVIIPLSLLSLLLILIERKALWGLEYLTIYVIGTTLQNNLFLRFLIRQSIILQFEIVLCHTVPHLAMNLSLLRWEFLSTDIGHALVSTLYSYGIL